MIIYNSLTKTRILIMQSFGGSWCFMGCAFSFHGNGSRAGVTVPLHCCSGVVSGKHAGIRTSLAAWAGRLTTIVDVPFLWPRPNDATAANPAVTQPSILTPGQQEFCGRLLPDEWISRLEFVNLGKFPGARLRSAVLPKDPDALPSRHIVGRFRVMGRSRSDRRSTSFDHLPVKAPHRHKLLL